MEMFCGEVLLAPWVFKPRETKHSPVVVLISFSFMTSFMLVTGLELYSGGSAIIKLYQAGKDLCVCVCAVSGISSINSPTAIIFPMCNGCGQK